MQVQGTELFSQFIHHQAHSLSLQWAVQYVLKLYLENYFFIKMCCFSLCIKPLHSTHNNDETEMFLKVLRYNIYVFHEIREGIMSNSSSEAAFPKWHSPETNLLAFVIIIDFP